MMRFCLFLLIFSGFFYIFPGLLEAQYYSKYKLKGDITLTYERWWSSDENISKREDFMHSYTLGVESFIIDPRLVSYEVEGLFTQEIKRQEENTTTNTYGISTRVSLINRPIFRGFWKNMPQPIELRFLYFKSNEYKTYNLGLSLTYRALERKKFHLQQQQQFQQRKKRSQQNQDQGQGEPEEEVIKKIPFLPVFFLDYDHYNYTSSSTKTDSDRLNIRAEERRENSEYRAEYNYSRFGGETKFKTQYLDVEANYFFYEKVANKKLEIYNRLYLTDYNDSKSLNLTNRTVWFKNLGSSMKDNLGISGGGSYYKSEDNQNYNLNATITLNSYSFGDSLRNTSIVNGLFGQNDNETVYNIGVLNDMSYNLSRIFVLNGRAGVGQNELGTNFLIGAGFSTRTAFYIAPDYTFTSTATSEGRNNSHTFTLNMGTRILRNLNFISTNTYKITSVGGDEPYNEDTLSLRGDLYWYISRLSINVGASHQVFKKKNGEKVDNGTTAIYSNISTFLTRRMFFNMRTIYETSKNGEKSLTIFPSVSWYIRLVTISAEYEMKKISGGLLGNRTDHRLYFRLTRIFRKNIWGFR